MKTPPSPKASAINLLSRREHTELELTRKLRTRGFTDTDIQSALLALKQEGLLSHSRFIESFIYTRSKKGYGPLRIQAELIARGIGQDMIDHHLNMSDNAWLTLAQQVWQKRFKGVLPRDYKTRASQMRFLQYRGFTPEQINQIFHSDAYEHV